MSFLNPVNLPVLRFSSTDADAPQINYNSRTAGDVKTVLKACLVTGYGAKASAGWSAVNEVDHVAEFVSPSAAMSDYRLGVNDTSASSTTWYYQYQDVSTDPKYNAPTKGFSYANKTHASNGWQLLVTDRGIMLIELVYSTEVNDLSSRITYWGAVKSALVDTLGQNICFFNIGHNATTTPFRFFSNDNYVHLNLGNTTSANISAANIGALTWQKTLYGTTVADIISPIYMASTQRDCLIAEFPAFLAKSVAKADGMYGVKDTALDSRSVLELTAGHAIPGGRVSAEEYGRVFVIYIDYWEY